MAKKLRRALVVGSGRAGLAATATLASAGVPVLLVSRSHALGAQSTRDHEGINALGTEDSEQHLAADTWRQGRGMTDQAALSGMGTRAALLGPWLAELGVPFTRNGRGQLARARLSGSSLARTLFVGGSTGRHLVSALDAVVRGFESVNACDAHGSAIAGERLVRRLEHWRLADLVLDDDGQAVGVVAQDCRTLSFKAFAADGIVLATGGYGGLFEGAAQNLSNLGAPLGVAYRHGAVLANLEFLQPNPTVVCSGPARVALPEWLSWLGARIWVTTKNAEDPRQVADKDRRYPLEKHEALVDAAQATQALFDAGAAPGGKGRAFLDLTHVEPERLAAASDSLGGVLGSVFGLDLARTPLPVSARIQHTLGGLWVDSSPATDGHESARQHTSNLPGLFAAGEACHQYHGAHALAGNLALGDLAGGQAAAQGVISYRNATEKSAFDLPNSLFDRPAAAVEEAFETMLKRDAGESPRQLVSELREAMAEGCGLQRDAEGLEALLEKLGTLQDRAQQVSVAGPSTVFNPEALLASELSDAIALARAVATAATSREESRGTHRRLDHDQETSTPGRCSLVQANSEGDAELVDEFVYTAGEERISIRAEASDGK